MPAKSGAGCSAHTSAQDEPFVRSALSLRSPSGSSQPIPPCPALMSAQAGRGGAENQCSAHGGLGRWCLLKGRAWVAFSAVLGDELIHCHRTQGAVASQSQHDLGTRGAAGSQSERDLDTGGSGTQQETVIEGK